MHQFARAISGSVQTAPVCRPCTAVTVSPSVRTAVTKPTAPWVRYQLMLHFSRVWHKVNNFYYWNSYPFQISFCYCTLLPCGWNALIIPYNSVCYNCWWLVTTAVCPASHWMCGDQMTCIPASHVCDGVANCPDRSDEGSCAHGIFQPGRHFRFRFKNTTTWFLR